MRYAPICLLVCLALPAVVDGIPARPIHHADGDISPLQAAISVTPGSALKNGDYVTVTWSVLRFPTKFFWIGVYLAGEDTSAIYPVKYKPIKGIAIRGKETFQLLNMRAPYVFYLMTGPLDTPIPVAWSNNVTFAKTNEPTQIHLTLTGKPSEMRATWTTGSYSCCPSYVEYGPVSGHYPFTAQPTLVTTYQRSDLCGGDATGKGFRDPGNFLSATMTGIAAGAATYYRVGNDDDGWSEEFSFAAPADRTQAVQLIAFGDTAEHWPDGSLQYRREDSPASANTTARVAAAAAATAAVLHLGDLSYAEGSVAVWEQFMSQVAPAAARAPWLAAVGNHERDWPGSGSAAGGGDSGGECGVPFQLRFPLPYAGADAPWYSMAVGGVHVCVLSTEHPLDVQAAWLVADLAKVNRALTPWVLVAGHRPMYVSSTKPDHIEVADRLRAALEPILYAAEVDIYISGHHHSYQRTCPLYRGLCVTPAAPGLYTAPIHFVVGTGGAPLTDAILKPQPPIFRVVDNLHHGFLRMTVSPSLFRADFVRSDDGQIHDTIVLTRPIAAAAAAAADHTA